MTTNNYVLIMYKCPVPGYWQPLHLCWLQDAEFKLKLNKRYYHDCGHMLDTDLVIYPEETAQKIIAYSKADKPYAEFALLRDI